MLDLTSNLIQIIFNYEEIEIELENECRLMESFLFTQGRTAECLHNCVNLHQANTRKLKSVVNELSEKIKNCENDLKEKRKKWKEKKNELKASHEQEVKLNQKLQMREAQYIHEKLAQEKLISSLSEYIKKHLNSLHNGSHPDHNPAIALTHSLMVSPPMNSGKQFFMDDYQRSIDVKHSSLIKDNVRLKQFLSTVHNQLIELVQYKRDSFVEYYCNKTGDDCSNDLNQLPFFRELNIEYETETLIELFNVNYIKLKDYLIHIDERSLSSDGNSFIFRDQNAVDLLEGYKRINRSLYSLVDHLMKLAESRHNEKCYLSNIIECLGSNHDIVQNLIKEIGSSELEISRLKKIHKIDTETHERFNESLSEELKKYSTLLDSVYMY